ncbi:sulfite dehydrogenase [Nitrospira sp.]|nr:sulfite dehydrogenase [Nitrospira sp.]
MHTSRAHDDPDRSKSEGDHDPTADRHLARRTLLVGTASWLGLSTLEAFSASSSRTPETVPDDPTKVPGGPTSSYGSRSRFETAARLAKETRSLTPHQDLHGIITPSALHFERHHNGVPTIDPARHRVLVHGLVDAPRIFTMDDLRRFPSVSRLVCIECSGNTAGEWTQSKGATVQETHGLMSTSEWTGVPLRTVLQEVGMRPQATWMLAEGSDAATLTRSLPIANVLDTALLCYAQNGEAIRPEQGYPIRLVIPGWEGNTHIKWLRRLKLGAAPFMTREETSRYTDLMPDGSARQFTFAMEAKSVITAPSGGSHLQPGYVDIRGLAWSGRGRIVRVDVSTDGGHTWQETDLQAPILPQCHTRFRLGWHWPGHETVLQSRCMDETGYVQPTKTALVARRGLHSTYHNNAIHSWKVTSHGRVVPAGA